MAQLASIARSLAYATCALALASACGGQSFAGNGGEAGTRATGQGGSASTAGKASTGGKAHGGSTSAGGMASAGSASGGSAHVYNEACDGPSEAGGVGGDAALQRWHHDPTTGICRPIWYGGGGATKNNYETLAACQITCPGGSPNIDACKVRTDCIVTAAGCCGVCDGPSLGAHDLIAYNKQYGIAVGCGGGPVPGASGDAEPGVGAPIACPDCAAPAPGTGSLKYFVPDCVEGQCVVDDIREDRVSACTTSADCQLRNGTSCCEACTSDDLVAVHRHMCREDGCIFSLEDLVCGAVQPPCLACAPGKPPNAVATCGPARHCIVEYVASGTDNAP